MASGSGGLTSTLFQRTCVTVEATTKQSAVILFLHGLGDTGHGWSQLIGNIRPSHAKVICPTAPVMPVTLNGGMRMPSWFDIYNLAREGKQDEEGIKNATKNVHSALEELEQCGTPANRILLGGFSQGGSLAIISALTYPRQLAGLLCLSCWVPVHEKTMKEVLDSNKEIPMLHCHGDADQVVSYSHGQMTAEFLKSINPKNHQFKTYARLGHSAGDQELNDVQEWIAKLLPPQGGAM